MSKTYVIYYGWLSDEKGELSVEAQRIADAHVPLLIAPLMTAKPASHVNLNAAVIARMHDAGTAVFAYVDTDYARVSPKIARRQVSDALTAGVDGIFYDQTTASPQGATLDYYETLSAPVKAEGKRIIANVGVAQCGSALMRFADHVMLEHRWRNLANGSPWTLHRGPETFMGVSSNEEQAMGYEVNEQRAVADTREAWDRNIGWHMSTELYAKLPAWFESYLAAIRTV
jgi:hypothetical protein